MFAHQDDELFALPYILNSDKKLFLYLTNGTSSNSREQKLLLRTKEAKEVFEKNLVKLNAEVSWWGLDKSIPEGELYRYVSEENIYELLEIINEHNEPATSLITTTFEGAHQDHDASAVIARELNKTLRIELIELSTYPQKFSKFYSFRVMKPLNPYRSIDFPRRNAVSLAFNLIRGYRTQRKTWLGLGPLLLFTYAFGTFFSVNPGEVRHLDSCFYEFRRRAKQEDVLKKLDINHE